MRILLIAVLLALPALGAEPQTEKKSESPAAASEEETVQTPFGRVKKQAPAPKPEPRPGAVAAMVDVEIADGVATFKRKTPFGVQSWKRPLDQLSADEKTLLEDSRVAKAAKVDEADAPRAELEKDKAAPGPR